MARKLYKAQPADKEDLRSLPLHQNVDPFSYKIRQGQVPARCKVPGQLASVSVQQVRALSALVRVLEVPVDESPLKCPWCVPLPVPVVQFLRQAPKGRN